MVRDAALIYADAHLAPGAWSSRPEITGDSIFAFEWLINYAIQHGVSTIVSAGDMIDVRRPPSSVVSVIRREMARCSKSNVAVRYIDGQHEKSTPPWLSAVSRHPRHVHREKFEIELEDSVLTCYGIDWTPIDELQAELDLVPEETDILFMHQVFDEFMGDVAACEASFAQVPHASVLITGDYHVYKHVSGKKNYGAQMQKLDVFSPGSTCMQSIDEPINKYCLVLKSDGKIEQLQIPSRPFIEININDDDELEGALDLSGEQLIAAEAVDLPELLQKPIVWVKYVDNLPEAHQRLSKAFKNAHLFLKPVHVTQEDAELVIQRKARDKLISGGLSSCLELMVPKHEPLYGPIRQLLESDDPKQTIREMKQERGL